MSGIEGPGVIGGGGSGTPAGSNTQVQYNNNGVFGGSANLTFTSGSVLLNVGQSNVPGTVSVGQLDSMVVNGVTVPVPGFALNSNIQGVIENHSYVSGGATGGARYYGVRSRGTISAPTIVQSGDNLSSIYAAGYNGTGYSLAGQILFTVGNTPGAADMPGDLDFLLSPDGSQTPTSRLKLFNTGAIGINGSQGTAGNSLISGGTGAAASWSTPTALAGATVTDGNGNSVSLTASDGVGTNRNGGNVNIQVGNLTGSGTQGRIVLTNMPTASTVGSAGGASALPATPSGYLMLNINGTAFKIPYYAN